MGTGGGAATAGPSRAPGRRGRRGAAMTSSRTSLTPAAPDPVRIGDRARWTKRRSRPSRPVRRLRLLRAAVDAPLLLLARPAAAVPPRRRHNQAHRLVRRQPRRTRVLGTPNEQTWPGVSSLPDYKSAFPRWQAEDLATVVPNLEPVGLDLLSKMFRFEPNKRITARQALEHEYFKDMEMVQ